jgi:hypothetical protein
VDWFHAFDSFTNVTFHLANVCVCYGLLWVHAGYMLDKHKSYGKRVTRICFPRRKKFGDKDSVHQPELLV